MRHRRWPISTTLLSPGSSTPSWPPATDGSISRASGPRSDPSRSESIRVVAQHPLTFDTRKGTTMHHDNDQRGRRRRTTALLAAGALMLALLPPVSAAAGPDFGGWAPADKIDEIAGNHQDLNTTSLDGCPAQSPDGLLFFMASNRPGGKGGLDIWMASRPNTSDAVGSSSEPARADQLGLGRLLPDPVRGRRAALREPSVDRRCDLRPG